MLANQTFAAFAVSISCSWADFFQLAVHSLPSASFQSITIHAGKRGPCYTCAKKKAQNTHTS